ncbi:MAG: hypothetical protein OES20_13460 [Gammaproteobacteria bacterium]|nr:hypothetical protein [Gammaproteobacteria bacterium]MDH3856732.1 hypothetical protein [Gammaproteobacteria bacterium]
MRISIPALLLIFNLNLVQAQEESVANPSGVKGVGEKIAQKIKMVNHILHSADLLQRVKASGDSVARELLARAAENFLKGEEYFDRGQYLEAEAVLDYVLRDLSASSRLLSVSQQKKSRYRHFIEQLDSFALPEWRNLDELENDLLQKKLERISALRDQAVRQAEVESYDEAMAMLEHAYRLKVSLIDEFSHETLVVYDLKFETVQDEYQYMVNRAYHYLELVQIAMTQGVVEEQTQKLADQYLYSSMLNLDAAEEFETQGQFPEAISILDNSINQLSAVLKLLGVKI